MPHQVAEHLGYVHLILSGLLDSGTTAFDGPDADAIFGHDHVLVDYTDVTGFQLDVQQLADLALRTERRGVRVAICAPANFLYAVNRQVLLLSGVREGETAAVFRDLEQARSWLLAA